MRTQNQLNIKTFEQLIPKFSNEPGLQYVDRLEFPNNSVYRGQIKIVDEATRKRLESNEDNSNSFNSKGAIQNRLSNKGDSQKDSQMGSQGNNKTVTPDPQNEEDKYKIRHGYGVQFWIDGAHYEGYWINGKAEG